MIKVLTDVSIIFDVLPQISHGDLCNCFELSHQNPMKAFDLFFVNITLIVSSANLRLVPRNIIANRIYLNKIRFVLSLLHGNYKTNKSKSY